MSGMPRHCGCLAYLLIIAAFAAWMLFMSLRRTLPERPIMSFSDCVYVGEEWDNRTPYEIERYGDPGRYALWDCGGGNIIRVALQ